MTDKAFDTLMETLNPSFFNVNFGKISAEIKMAEITQHAKR